MPNGMIPAGYRAVLIGSASTIEELKDYAPMEEGVAEGSLMLMRLDFEDFPSPEALSQLNSALVEEGVPAWPGYEYIVHADTAQPSVYLAWQKGIAWLPVILGLLGMIVLPPLLGSLIWLILPEPVKQLITGLIQIGMILLVVWLMMSLIKPLTAERPKRVEEARA